MAPSRPIGPAPVTSTRRGSRLIASPIRLICSTALATTVVGSISIPTERRPGSSLTQYSLSTRRTLRAVAVELVDPSLLEEAVAAHVEFAPGAGVAGDRVGTADDPDDEVTGREVPSGAASLTIPRDSCPSTSRSRPAGAWPYSPAMISRSVPQTPIASVDQDIPLLEVGLADIGHRGRAGVLRNDGQCPHRGYLARAWVSLSSFDVPTYAKAGSAGSVEKCPELDSNHRPIP